MQGCVKMGNKTVEIKSSAFFSKESLELDIISDFAIYFYPSQFKIEF